MLPLGVGVLWCVTCPCLGRKKRSVKSTKHKSGILIHCWVCGHEAPGQRHYSSFTILPGRAAGPEALQQAILARHIKHKRSSLFQTCQERTLPLKKKVIINFLMKCVKASCRRLLNKAFWAITKQINISSFHSPFTWYPLWQFLGHFLLWTGNISSSCSRLGWLFHCLHHQTQDAADNVGVKRGRGHLNMASSWSRP